MTTSIAVPCPLPSHRPVLRRLVDILPAIAPATPEPLRATAPPADDPAASLLAERVVRAMVETLGGRRPTRQLATMLRPDLLASLASLQVTAEPLQPRVRKVVARPQSPGVVEAVAVVTLSTGVRALAARFEKPMEDQGARWQCTALQLRLTAGDLAARHRCQPR
ncbi:MAG: Rv3235 family protein [Pseudonocardiaceae bacterium]